MRSFLALTACVCVALTAPVSAAEWVEFEDGRVMEVEAVVPGDDVVVLELAGGGSIAVPPSLIVDREPIEVAAALPVAGTPRAGRAAPGAGGRWRVRAGDLADLLAETGARHGVEASLLAAMAVVESNFDPFAVSPKGACGLLQLMPATAERFGVDDVFDVGQNVDGGARYLRWLLDRYDGDRELALAAYNAGEGAVDRYRGIPPYRETRNYVAKVLEWHRTVTEPAGGAAVARAHSAP